ncbi:MAG: hypothetical protein JSU86_07215 [Phycisphaerales bacterium]|nr:MAG: hypothetical protein JSU86_07215 [Phycisphaerales bacterium]
MRKVHLIALGVSLAVAWASTPAAAIDVIWTSDKTTVVLDPGYTLEDPVGTVGEYKLLEWLDADYIAPGDYKDWTDTGTGTPDGSSTQVWLRALDWALSTTSTVPSSIVSVHLPADFNDGLADVEVDGVLAARLDMHTHAGEPGSTNGALILVRGGAVDTHTIEVIDGGNSPDPGDHGHPEGYDDVHIWGAAVLGGPGVACKGPACPTHGQKVHFDPKAPGQCYQMPQDSPVWEQFTDNLDAPLEPWHWETSLNAGEGMELGMIFHCYGVTLAGILVLPQDTNVYFDINCPESPEIGDHTFSLYARGEFPKFQLDTSIAENEEGGPYDDVFPHPDFWTVSDVDTVRAMNHIEMEAGPQIPAVTEWGLVVMLLLVVAAGTIVIRRRRTVAA